MAKTDDKPKDSTVPDEIVREALERFKIAEEAVRENRAEALDDLRFFAGEQWPVDVKNRRARRPCHTINKLPGFVDQVVGDQRQNRPQIKVRPAGGGSDPDTAEVLNGLIRNIENNSQADVAYDHAFEHQVICSEGYWRVLTEYTDDDAFEQDIVIERIRNPLSVFLDPAARKADKSDGMYGFVVENYTREQYERAFPDKPVGEWESAHVNGWVQGDVIRVGEYFRKIPVERTLYQLETGEVLADIPSDLLPQMPVKTQRKAKTYKVEWFLMNGHEILDGPNQWAGKYIPIVPDIGKEVNIDGEERRRGLVRFAKDSQRSYNYSRSTATETIALAPRVPYLLTAKQLGAYKPMWDAAQYTNFPYLLYEPDNEAGGRPQRELGAQFPSGLLEEMQIASDEMKATTGIYDASLGARSNEQSGRAILARQREGDTATYAYHDNHIRALQYCGRILVDLIPKIYDTDRIIRILGEDGKAKLVRINQSMMDMATGRTVILNDLTRGKYDVFVDTGPSYNTQRIETVNMMMQLGQSWPQLFALAGDILAGNFDWPQADRIAKRIKKSLPPGLADDEEQVPGQGGANGGQPPPEQQQPPPDPLMMAKLQQEQIKIEQEKAKLAGLTLENELKRVKILETVGGTGAAMHSITGILPEQEPPSVPAQGPASGPTGPNG